MIKFDYWICGWGEGGGVEFYVFEQVNFVSYDVCVSDEWICLMCDLESFKVDSVKFFLGEVVFVCMFEYVCILCMVVCDFKFKLIFG